MSQEDIRAVRIAMFEAVEEQIRKGVPAETRLTLERLCGQGHSRPEAIRLIATVLANEIYRVTEHEDARFDKVSYAAALAKLPTLPWE